MQRVETIPRLGFYVTKILRQGTCQTLDLWYDHKTGSHEDPGPWRSHWEFRVGHFRAQAYEPTLSEPSLPSKFTLPWVQHTFASLCKAFWEASLLWFPLHGIPPLRAAGLPHFLCLHQHFRFPFTTHSAVPFSKAAEASIESCATIVLAQ